MDTNLSPLPEEEFINDGKGPRINRSFGFWPLLIVAVVGAFWLGGSWITEMISEKMGGRPFLRVTNREFSLFLWQNPQFMRVHAKRKAGYLTGFEYFDRTGLDPAHAEEYVVAPPQILFFYHTWDRLLSSEFTRRAMPISDFRKFLAAVPEWDPRHWADAPKSYVELVKNLDALGDEDIQKNVPKEVQLAFAGWKNYFQEGSAINALRPTYEQMEAFLKRFPHYARPYWWNIVKGSLPNYLLMGGSGSAQIPEEELSEFLKVAFFNDQASTVINPAG